MKAADLRQLTEEELAARIRQFRDEVFTLRNKHATGQIEDTASMQATRRNLARALSVSAEKGKS